MIWSMVKTSTLKTHTSTYSCSLWYNKVREWNIFMCSESGNWEKSSSCWVPPTLYL